MIPDRTPPRPGVSGVVPDGRAPGPFRLVVLASGSGTLLQALLDATRDRAFGATVVGVGSDRPGVPALDRAHSSQVGTFVVPVGDHADRPSWDRVLAGHLAELRPDLVVTAGFLKLLGPRVLAGAPVLNTHPALLPAFRGMHAVRDALAYGVVVTGCTVHLVDAGIDTGPVVAQAVVPVRDDDNEHRLHERIKIVERRLLVDVVGRMARGGWSVAGRRVVVG